MALITNRDELIGFIDNEINRFILTPALSNLPMEELYTLITSNEYKKLRERYKNNLVLKCWALSLGYKVYKPEWLDGMNKRIPNIDVWEKVVFDYMNNTSPKLTKMDKLEAQYQRN
jgi:hypothetical protein